MPANPLGWRLWVIALLGATGVMAGAFAAHGLRGRVPDAQLLIWETAADYQLLHTVVLLALLGVRYHLAEGASQRWLGAAESLFVGGILVFSGSLYLLVLTATPLLGAVTPVGGLALIAGWASLAVAGLSHRKTSPTSAQ